jgi:hemerythrin-like domain-containing protein/nucleotide-binding universal stress UspA family protein
MYRHLLVPLDDTGISADNVSAAVEFARTIGARITFFHAQADYSATGDGALMHAMSPSTFADRAAGGALAILAKAEAAARAAGVTCRAVCSVSDKPAQAIVEAAERESCDLVFMASHGPTSIGGVMLGSQTLKVLAGAKTAVLVSRVARNAEHAARDAAIARIKDEHRSLAAVLHLLRRVASEKADGKALDTQLLRGAIHYLRAFPQTLHHPKEERYIFARLRRRSPELDRVLDELELEHTGGVTLLDALACAIDAYEREPDSGSAVARAIEAFTIAQWRHIETEERTVLPAAQELLTDAEWRDIAKAFEGNGDPRFDRLIDGEFRAMFARVMNLAPRAGSESASEQV